MDKYLCDKTIFYDIKTEEESYWLGFIMADGCNINDRTLRVDIKDSNHLEKLSKLIYPNGDKPIQTRDLGHGNVYMFSCGHKEILSNLKNYGIIQRKSMCTKLPNLRDDLYRHFIRGLFDGDGSISYTYDKKSKNYRRYNFSIVGNYELMVDIQKIIEKQTNIKLNVHKMKMIHRVIKKGNVSIVNIMDWLYNDSNIYLDRKYEKYKELKLYYSNTRKHGSRHTHKPI